MRIGRTIVSQACVVAYGVRQDGARELIGLDIVDTESEPSWTTFLRSLCDRGLTGVKLVITDAHGGLVKALESVLVGASWQRCKVHYADLRIMPMWSRKGPSAREIAFRRSA